MGNLRFKHFIFDCDSTLSSIEGLDRLADLKGLNGKVSSLTALAMNGEISFEDAFRKRIDLIEPTLSDLDCLAKDYKNNLVEGAFELISWIKSREGEVFIVSGGIKKAILPLGQELGIPGENIFGTELIFTNGGEYLQIANNDIFAFGKAGIIGKIAKKGPTVMIGDGANDLEASSKCDLFIGFGGVVERAVVKKNASIYYEGKNMLGLKDFFI